MSLLDSFITSNRARAEQAYKNSARGSGLNPEYVSTVVDQKPKNYVDGTGLAFGSYPLEEGLIQKVQWNENTEVWDNFGDPMPTQDFVEDYGTISSDNRNALKIRGGTSSEIEDETIEDREIYYDTEEDRPVAGSLKRYLVGLRDTGKKINTIADLEGDTPGWFETLFSATPKRDMLGYSSVGDGGGSELYWDADRDKQDHNAGTVWSPTWNNGTFGDPTDDNWHDPDPTDTGSGCWVLLSGSTEQGIILTVGNDGMYPTINEALEAASIINPRYVNNSWDSSVGDHTLGYTFIEIKILSGFTMEEQVIVEGQDLGYIKITSEDAEVPVDRSSLTKIPNSGRKPVFCGRFNAILPVISALFVISGTQPTTDDGTSGIFIIANSQVTINDKGCGVKGAGRGLHVSTNSRASAKGGIFSDCYIGLRISNGGYVNFREGVAKNCDVGINTNNSLVTCNRANLTGALNRGIDITDGRINCARVDVSDSDDQGIRLSENAILIGREIVAQNCTTGLYMEQNSTARCYNLDARNCNRSIFAEYSNVYASNSLLDDNISDSPIVRISAGTADISNSSLTNAIGDAIRATHGSKIIARGVDLTNAGGDCVTVFWGSEVFIYEAIYDENDLSQDVNIRTLHGLIDDPDVSNDPQIEINTWTPVFQDTSGNTVEGGEQKYAKNNKICHLFLDDNVDLSGLSGNITIGGLPFIPDSDAVSPVIHGSNISYPTDGKSLIARMSSNNNRIDLLFIVDGDSPVNLSDTQIGGPSDYTFDLTYQIS